jgi:hypothetical protein
MTRNEIHIGDNVLIVVPDHTKPSPSSRYDYGTGRVTALRESLSNSGVIADIVSQANQIWRSIDIAFLVLAGDKAKDERAER